MDADQLVYVLRIIVDDLSIPTIEQQRCTQISRTLEFSDFGRLKCVNRALRDFVSGIKYMCYRIDRFDYEVYKCVRIHGDALLYYIDNTDIIRRFLQLFGYTYGSLDARHVVDYYRGYEPDYANGHKITPLLYRLGYNHIDVAEVIIQQSPQSLDCVDVCGRTPMYFIILKKADRVLKHVVTNHPEYINRQCHPDYGTPLAFACFRGRHAMGLLLEHGADPNIPSPEYGPPIFISMDFPDELRILLTSKIPIDFTVTNPAGETIQQYIDLNKQNTPDEWARWDFVEQILRPYLT